MSAISVISIFILQKLVEEPEIAVAEDGLFILGKNSFAKHIEKGSHFIKFYAPWCGHCKVSFHVNGLSYKSSDNKKFAFMIFLISFSFLTQHFPNKTSSNFGNSFPWINIFPGQS